jgi:hypothetical protein
VDNEASEDVGGRFNTSRHSKLKRALRRDPKKFQRTIIPTTDHRDVVYRWKLRWFVWKYADLPGASILKGTTATNTVIGQYADYANFSDYELGASIDDVVEQSAKTLSKSGIQSMVNNFLDKVAAPVQHFSGYIHPFAVNDLLLTDQEDSTIISK